jgi:argininosuccinate lyase
MEDATKTGFITATDLADYLVLRDVPFRDAHGIVGRAVASCIEKGCELTDLSLEEMREFSPIIDKSVFAVLSVEGSVNSRKSIGGTASVRVEDAVRTAENIMGIRE